MTFQSKRLGQTGKNLAAAHLKKQKLQILQQNLKTNFGEIDILARDRQTLVIAVVKTKTSTHFGSAIELITRAKQQKLILLAHELQARYQTESVRIDIITVDEAGLKPLIKHYKGIIEFHG